MNGLVFGKTIKNFQKQSDNKPVIAEKRRNYLVSEPNYHTTKSFAEICWL